MTRAAVLSGIGGYVPPRVVTNDELAQRLDTTDSWIRTRTGITERHIIDPGTTTSDLAVEAGARALKSAGTSHADLVVVATTTPDRICPASAPTVASRLGLVGVPAFDVAAVCSGFVYALHTAAAAVIAELADSVLVIGAESFSTLLDPEDRTTTAIFGDGAGAVLLRAGELAEPGAVLGLHLGSDGGFADLITVPGGGAEERSRKEPAHPKDRYFRMNGKGVFRTAVQRMTESSRTALSRTGWDVADVDRVVAHQANVRIIQAVAEQLGLPPESAVVNIDKVGNTSAASIPLALADATVDGVLRSGHRVLLTAFGGGATWGAATLVWPELTAQ